MYTKANISEEDFKTLGLNFLSHRLQRLFLSVIVFPNSNVMIAEIAVHQTGPSK